MCKHHHRSSLGLWYDWETILWITILPLFPHYSRALLIFCWPLPGHAHGLGKCIKRQLLRPPEIVTCRAPSSHKWSWVYPIYGQRCSATCTHAWFLLKTKHLINSHPKATSHWCDAKWAQLLLASVVRGFRSDPKRDQKGSKKSSNTNPDVHSSPTSIALQNYTGSTV